MERELWKENSLSLSLCRNQGPRGWAGAVAAAIEGCGHEEGVTDGREAHRQDEDMRCFLVPSGPPPRKQAELKSYLWNTFEGASCAGGWI